jgi:hypothetical protein
MRAHVCAVRAHHRRPEPIAAHRRQDCPDRRDREFVRPTSRQQSVAARHSPRPERTRHGIAHPTLRRSVVMTASAAIDQSAPPTGTGCVECLANSGWWLHLRRCAACGHIGCCDTSPSQHASQHAALSAHPVAQSYEPGEDWFWDYRDDRYVNGPPLQAPTSHPRSQPVPGPAGAVPADWQIKLH